MKKPTRSRESEDVLAAELQNKRGHTEHWSKKPVGATIKKPLAVTFSMRMSSAELQELRERAGRQGLSISEYIRKRALADDASTVNVSTSAPFYIGGGNNVGIITNMANWHASANSGFKVIGGPINTVNTCSIPVLNLPNFYFHCDPRGSNEKEAA